MRLNNASVCTTLILLALSGCASVKEPGLPAEISERPQLGMRVRVTPASEVPTGVSAGRKQVLTVIKVYAKSAAELAGVRTGDVLLALDGVPVTGMRESFSVMQTKRRGEAVDVTVYRDSEVQHVLIVTAPPSAISGS